ncbi:ABC transporter ATP-binding protein [Aquirhabdus parva]|uniref:ABC transporter ATP-binding protein n=1 Tax=Aquirhabdus parva TaxID=2283318 RepID=A0A345PA88_9GAMM|nr:ABC transporter ATP-binding protein [Aquirhabdus parva]AXI04197.1 ABC transporter ATP-binding protein [Aquirhabdus parva]
MSVHEKLLSVSNLHVRYGNIHAMQGLNIEVNQGELVCLIGANGAGKSSTLNALAGLVPSTGSVIYQGKEISTLASHQRVGQGLALVPEGRGVFSKMTVLENLQMGAYLHDWRESELESIFARFPRLAERRDQLAGTLSGGEQQMLAIGRALLSRPKLLLLDEPSMGLAPLMIELIFKTLAELKETGLSILLVEQNARGALQLADRAYVLEHGEMTLSGTGQDLLHDARVQAAYLGAGIEA